MSTTLTFGLARMHKEPGERRDFLPAFVHRLARQGAHVILEEGYGSGVGAVEADYTRKASTVRFASHDEVYRQDYVLVLRYPSEAELRLMRPGACLISMVHYPTRPDRVEFLRQQNLEAISLDSVKDDNGRRLVENLRAVGWNGVEMAFQALRSQWPDFESAERQPIHVTLMGAGAVGGYAMQAAVRYGDAALWSRLAAAKVPGVQVTVVDYDTTQVEPVMRDLLTRTDLLIDATQRPDPSQWAIPNVWIADLPPHAVILDLSVDPYNCTKTPPVGKAVEGVPQGSLDQVIFKPDDPAFDAIPSCINTTHRRTSVSCYSWPGIHPKECMVVYGHQIAPLLRNVIEVGGIQNLQPTGRFFQRAIATAVLSRWSQSQKVTHDAQT